MAPSPVQAFLAHLSRDPRLQAQVQAANEESKEPADQSKERVRRDCKRVVMEMVEKDGVMSFYRGMASALVGTVASFGSYFFCYRLLKNIVLHTFKLTES